MYGGMICQAIHHLRKCLDQEASCLLSCEPFVPMVCRPVDDSLHVPPWPPVEAIEDSLTALSDDST
jgi:hypothetical protein